jgi:trigger factor
LELQIEKEQLNPVEIELKVTVPAEIMIEKVETALESVVRHAAIPGFRPGKIPRKIAIEKFGSAITNDIVQKVLQEAYKEALDESKLEPVAPGEMSDINFERGTPLTFKAKIEVRPEVEIPDFSDLTAELLQPQVEEDDLMEALDNLRESHAVLAPTDDPVDEDTVIVVDFQELDRTGLPFVGRFQKDIEVDMRRNRFGEEFAHSVKGLKSGTTAIVVFENNSQGKAQDTKTQFQVTVQNIQRKELPTLDDEFAHLVNEKISTLDELKNDLKRYIELRAQHKAHEKMLHEVVESALHRVSFPLPPRMLENYLEQMAEDSTKRQQGKIKPEHKEEFKTNYRASAIWNLRWYFLQKKLVEEQNLEVTDEEYAHELERHAMIDNRTVEDLKKSYSSEQVSHIKSDLLEGKVLRYLESQVQVVPRQITLAEFEGRVPGKVITA